jgi:uncharacterized cupredoxin-like copper-binding protein
MRYATLPRPALGLIAALTVALLIGACGSAGGQVGGNSVEVPITLSEFKIDSPQTAFTTDRPYRFVIKNVGVFAHDWAIMPRGETDESQALVQVDESQLPPQATLSQDFTFFLPGDFEFVCHVPGRYEAAMSLAITVQ